MDVQQSNFKKWFIVFSAGMFFFYEYIQMTLFNTMPKQLIIGFNISACSLGKLSACYFFMQIFLLIPAGILLDRFSTKKIIFIAMGISITGTLLFSYAQSYQFAVIARLLSGVGGAFAFLSCIKVATDCLPQKLSLATALLITLAVLGGFIAQTLLAWITDETSWRTSLRILSCFGIFILINILLNVKITNQKIIHKKVSTIFTEIWAVLKNKQTILISLYIMLMNLPIFLLGSLWGSLYLQQTHHLNSILAAFVASMLFFGMVIGSPIFVFFSEKIFFRKKSSMLLATILSLMISIALVFTNNNHIFYLVALFLSLGFVSSAQCLGYPLIIENNNTALAATATSIASVIVMGGGALIKIAYGRILDLYSNYSAIQKIPEYSKQAFQLATMLLPIACIFAIILTQLVREKSTAL